MVSIISRKVVGKQIDRSENGRNCRLPIECPELFFDHEALPVIKPLRILELGCGVGKKLSSKM